MKDNTSCVIAEKRIFESRNIVGKCKRLVDSRFSVGKKLVVVIKKSSLNRSNTNTCMYECKNKWNVEQAKKKLK